MIFGSGALCEESGFTATTFPPPESFLTICWPVAEVVPFCIIFSASELVEGRYVPSTSHTCPPSRRTNLPHDEAGNG